MIESSGPDYGDPGYSGGPGGPGYGWYPPPPPPRRGGRGILSHLGVAVLAAAVGAGATLALDPATSSSPTAASGPSLPGSSAVPSPPSSPSATAPSSSSSGGATGVQSVINKVEPGIVIINSTIQYQSEAGAGTGMVINSDGLVLTNNHVIEDSTKLTATVVATGKTYPATVVGYDTTGDVALIKLQGASGLTTIPLGNSSAVRSGASVVALGNAEGQGTILPAAGTITGTNKTITASDQGGTIATETLHGMLETNAHIVPGDSGGPLSNASGQVIGMDTAGQSVSFGQQATPTGFAIPINTALSVASQIAAGKASSTISIGYPPFIGIYVAQGTSSNPQAQAQQQSGSAGNSFGGGFGGFGGQSACYTSNANLQVPAQVAPVNSGTLIDGVICGSPAEKAGMTAGAVITAVNGKTVGAPNQLQSILATFRPGDTVTITWANLNGQSTTSTLHLAAGPPL
ncbi:MAG TPA: trypsin-like peptidase domain-containing protein [Trebonia sp.]|nr:trypsin-like peptidase domain-containing protein [Trebonia sp.]